MLMSSSRGATMIDRPWRWVNERWAFKAYTPDWRRGQEPIAVLSKRPHAVRGKGRPTRQLKDQLHLIVLRERVRELMRLGVSEREALLNTMVQVGWRPATEAEFDRLRREIRRMD